MLILLKGLNMIKHFVYTIGKGILNDSWLSESIQTFTHKYKTSICTHFKTVFFQWKNRISFWFFLKKKPLTLAFLKTVHSLSKAST